MWDAIKRYKERRARGDRVKPIWQIAILLPIAIIAHGSEKLLDYLENAFNPPDPNFWND